jgi:hypothetical protein
VTVEERIRVCPSLSRRNEGSEGDHDHIGNLNQNSDERPAEIYNNRRYLNMKRRQV